jgi:hypothetical protein
MSSTVDNHALKYVLDCLQRAADNSSVWPVYPSESGALLSEIRRLQTENEELKAKLRHKIAPLGVP